MKAVAAADEIAGEFLRPAPSCRKRIFGAVPAKSWTLTSSTSNRICPPSASRRAIRSFTTSCWP